jgi:beta-phosphoglucomutase-like phosphatase (HAD superfamily)
MGKFRAVIFDMDGVLVDSEPLFLNAINRLLAEENASLVSEEENEAASYRHYCRGDFATPESHAPATTPGGHL